MVSALMLAASAMAIRVTMAPIVFHHPPILADYHQENDRVQATEQIRARLLHPPDEPGPWRYPHDNREPAVRVLAVIPRADGERAFISHISGTAGQSRTVAHYELLATVQAHGQTRTIVGAETVLFVTANRVADQISAWALRDEPRHSSTLVR
jgi:hypothetical protein